MATVEIRNVTKTYDRTTQVIHGVSVDIADGEFIVIVGPSGCGKSTLLRMVAGLEPINSGEIAIDGEVVNDLEPMDRNIAMVFQNYALYPHMSVFDNMAYGLRNRKVPVAEIKKKVDEAAEILELNGLLKRRPSQLSGGQRQRVAMGRAIVRSPKVFLFDEPLSNLDAKLRVSMRIEIKRLQRELGITSIYVTHDQVEAMTLADRLIAMNDGRAEQIGTPLDLYESPRTQFVGGFIGSPPMNFIPARVERSALIVGDVTVAEGTDLAESTSLLAGIRPEHITLAEPGDGLEAVVDIVEPLGAETLVYAHLASGVSAERVAVRIHGRAPCRDGDRVGLKVRPDDVCAFSNGGERLR